MLHGELARAGVGCQGAVSDQVLAGRRAGRGWGPRSTAGAGFGILADLARGGSRGPAPAQPNPNHPAPIIAPAPRRPRRPPGSGPPGRPPTAYRKPERGLGGPKTTWRPAKGEDSPLPEAKAPSLGKGVPAPRPAGWDSARGVEPCV